jgi:hypothetical protein
MIWSMIRRCRVVIDKRITLANNEFNCLSVRKKKTIVLVFGIAITGISILLINQALHPQENKGAVKSDRISMPHDIFMKDEIVASENQLIPVGKMKGEIDGEFESFYVAVDSKGSIFINRNIEYSEKAYEKSESWKQISKEKLNEYEKDLHFIPARSKGIKR